MPQLIADFATDFAQIDQQAVWLLPFLPIHHAFKESFAGGELSDWLNEYFYQNNLTPTNSSNKPLTFTSQNALPHGTAYEAFIAKTGKIPTRNNLHDWFGACIWSIFPESKALLNAKHIANLTDDNQRNRLRDTATIFDENGAILVVCDDDVGQSIGASLQHFDWRNCLVTPRHAWHNPYCASTNDKAQLFIFGHALLEQLITPRKPLCSHTLIITMPATFFHLSLSAKLHTLDKKLRQTLDALLVDGVTPRQFNPLPVLGVPHFWQENSNATFYQDDFVFRAGRQHHKTQK